MNLNVLATERERQLDTQRRESDSKKVTLRDFFHSGSFRNELSTPLLLTSPAVVVVMRLLIPARGVNFSSSGDRMSAVS